MTTKNNLFSFSYLPDVSHHHRHFNGLLRNLLKHTGAESTMGGVSHRKSCKSESPVPDFCKYLLISVWIEVLCHMTKMLFRMADLALQRHGHFSLAAKDPLVDKPKPLVTCCCTFLVLFNFQVGKIDEDAVPDAPFRLLPRWPVSVASPCDSQPTTKINIRFNNQRKFNHL